MTRLRRPSASRPGTVALAVLLCLSARAQAAAAAGGPARRPTPAPTQAPPRGAARATRPGARCSDLAVVPTTRSQDPESPPDPDNATLVDIGIFVTQVSNVDHNRNTYEMSGFLDLVWCDPRRAPADGRTALLLEEHAAKALDGIWWPDVEFVNAVGKPRAENQEIEFFPDGTVEYREKFDLVAQTNLDLHRFPFDTQELLFQIESFAWPADRLRFHLREDVLGLSDEFKTPGWEFVGLDEHIVERREVRDRAAFSELQGVIHVRRISGFYVIKVIIPLSVIILMVSVVSWLPPDQLKDRIGATLTGLLTSAAYGITVSNYLPRHVYRSFLDSIVLFSFAFMALLMIENGLSNHLWRTGRQGDAERLDRLARWAFPVGYLVALAVIALATQD